MFRSGLAVVAGILLNNLAGDIGGDPLLGGIGVSTKIMMFPFSIILGFGTGFQPVAGFCYGAKQFDRVRKSYYFTLFVSTLIQLLFALLLFFFARHTVQLFQKAQEVVQVGTRAIRFYALSLPFLPLSVVTNMLLQVTGKNKQSIFLSSCRQGIFFLPLIFILPRFFGITGLELSQPLANLLSGLIAIPFLVKARFTYQDKTY
jgi:Na+-driven multidrug efflux pump